MNRKLLSALLLCLTFSAVQSQDKNFKNWFQAAQEHMLYEEYNEALKKYALIESHGQLNSNVAFNMGMCYINL